MLSRSRLFTATALTTSFSLIFASTAYAHTNSIGYENAGPGSVTFWYGSWHEDVNFTEGSLQVVGPGGYNITQAFSMVVTVKPGGLLDGTTNFYSNGAQLVGTDVDMDGTFSWQGATLAGLSPGTYTFTYIPIGMPTQTWQPKDGIILSSSVFLNAAIVGGSFKDNSTTASYGAASVLDDIADSATGAMGDLIEDLQGLDPDEQQAVLQRLAPQTSQAISNAGSQAVSGALDSVSARLDSIRSEGYTSAAADRLSRGEEIQVASAGDLSGLFSGTGRHHSFWTKAFGVYARQGLDEGFAGYHAKTGGIAFGMDTLLESDWVVGSAFTFAATDVSMDHYRNGDDADIRSYQITGYGSRDFGKWYVEGMAAFAYQNFSTERNTGITGIALGDFNGKQYAARMTAGYPVPLENKVVFTPSAGMEWNYFTQEGYTEIGGGPAGMSVNGVDAMRLRSVIEGKLSTEKQYEDYKIIPSIHAGWRHEFRNDGLDSTTSFTGGGGSFTTSGQDTQRNTLNLGGKLSISQTQDFTLSIQLDTERASNYAAYAGQLLGQWRF